jgi:hypothetical protein
VLQAADVWTTKEGVKYDCVYEANPLLPKVPHVDRLLIHKTVFLHPFGVLKNEDMLDNTQMIFPILLTAWVVNNNLKVIDRAKSRCNLR